MQLICVCLHGQCVELYHKVCCILLFLLEDFNLPLSICCLCLVTECCLDFLDELFPILGFKFFIQLIELSLYIYAHYTFFEVSQDCCDPVISFYDPVTLEKQSHSSPSVFKFHSVTVKLSWVQYYIFWYSCLYILADYWYCWC